MGQLSSFLKELWMDGRISHKTKGVGITPDCEVTYIACELKNWAPKQVRYDNCWVTMEDYRKKLVRCY